MVQKITTIVFAIGLFVLSLEELTAQDNSTLSRQLVAINDCRIDLGEDMIVPHSIVLYHKSTLLNQKAYQIAGDTVLLTSDLCATYKGDSLLAYYRVFPVDLTRSYQLLDSNSMQSEQTAIQTSYNLDLGNNDSSLLGRNNLSYNGSFSRGFSVGNAQSLVLNSNLDLQMTGDIGDGIRVTAAISDDNIPIQPEGNTQILQEFDRVFIEVSKDRTSVIAGDFTIQKPRSHFINYVKKLKGLGITNAASIGSEGTLQTQVNAASSRGKFRRQIIDVAEGNQGPYRLQGNNNERFIIILSGTEKVFFNGELLQRGFNYDYTIDYNTGELTFSPQRLISRETRVIVEFEYTDQNYFRTLYTANTNYSNGPMELNFNFYSEQDSKTTTSQIELDSTDLSILGMSGDVREQTFRNAVREVNESNFTGIGYELISNPQYPDQSNDEFILVFQPDPNQATHIAAFSELGSGMGSYSIDPTVAVNGRVYRYVGDNLGSYAPIIELIPPEQRRMMSLGGKYQLSQKTSINSEVSMSDFDVNRISDIDDGDNQDFAAKVSLENIIPLDSARNWNLRSTADYELMGTDFRTLNPFRNAEFIRDWNISPDLVGRQSRTNLSTSMVSKKNGSFGYEFSNYLVGQNYQGNRHRLMSNFRAGGFHLITNSSFTQTNNNGLNTAFVRPNFTASQAIGKQKLLTVGMFYEGEQNKFTDENGDLQDGSFTFDYAKAFIRSNTVGPFQYGISFNKRVDRTLEENEIVPFIDIEEIELNTVWKADDRSDLQISLKGRNFDVIRPDLATANESSKRTLLGNVDHRLWLFKRALTSSTNYAISSGQEPKLEFAFAQVENNQGDYVFVGDDDDEIRTTNDFRYDPTNPLAQYIRIALPNNEFTRTNNISLNQTLNLEPSALWSQDTTTLAPWKRMASKFNSLTNIRLNNKRNESDTYRPLSFGLIDDNLVSNNALINHTIGFNRGNSAYDAFYTYRNNAVRTNQINGFEERTLQENEIRTRVKVINTMDLTLLGALGNRTFTSIQFEDSQFDIDFIKQSGTLSYRPSTKFRASLKYEYNDSKQKILNLERAITRDFTFEVNSRRVQSSSVDASVSYVNVSYDGTPNTSLEYDMLAGLKAGTNFLWRVNFIRRFASNIDLILNYEGRRTGDVPTIHVGRAQVKASF